MQLAVKETETENEKERNLIKQDFFYYRGVSTIVRRN